MKVTRRDFLKLSAGAGAAVLLGGYGPAWPGDGGSSELPLAGQAFSIATTCSGCPAGCGLIVRTVGGRAYKVEGNPAHPLNSGAICARGQAMLLDLYNPNRIPGPGRHSRGEKTLQAIDWDTAIEAISDIFTRYKGREIAFLLGLFPDHLYDLTALIARGMGGANVLRFDSRGEFDQRVTLMDACQRLFGASRIPSFDIKQADVIFSFGAAFTESWLSPMSGDADRGRQGFPVLSGYRVQFEPRRSRSAANADEWISIAPGSDAFLAQALAALIARRHGNTPGQLAYVDVSAVAQACGVPVGELERLARMFDQAGRKVAIPGSMALGSRTGLAAAEAILFLNAQVDNLGAPGGLFLMPDAPVYPENNSRASTVAEIQGLIARLNAGQIKAVLIHNTHLAGGLLSTGLPAAGLPAAYGFAEALSKAEQVISFSPYPDELSDLADLVLPDHMPLESWGYQKVTSGADRMTLSGLQPVIPPLYQTRATADVLLAAAQATGGTVAQATAFTTQVDFLQQAIAGLRNQGGIYDAPTAEAFWSKWSQNGGWWKEKPGLIPPINLVSPEALPASMQTRSPSGPADAGDKPLPPAEHPGKSPMLHLLLLYLGLDDRDQTNRMAHPHTLDCSTNRMDPAWVEIHPETAQELGLSDGDIAEVVSPTGKIEAVVSLSSSIRKDAVAIPVGEGGLGHGRFVAGGVAHPLDLLGTEQNETGSLAFTAAMVMVKPSAQEFPIS